MRIKINTIVKKYPLKTVLNNISYTFETGKFYSLLGENGAGKSTLANIIAGNIVPTSGSIEIFDNTIETQHTSVKNTLAPIFTGYFSHPREAQTFGIQEVLQRPLLADDLTVKENILLGNEHSHKALEILETVTKTASNYYKQSEALPLQPFFQIPLDKKVYTLTASERFFTSLVAALVTNPQFLILDEPGSFLDISQRNILYSYLQKRVSEGLGLLIISHNRLEALKISNIVLELEQGKLHQVTNFIAQQNSAISRKHNTAFNSITSSKLNKIEPAVFEIHHITSRPINRAAIFDISFTAHKKAITVICGQRESGLETLENIITGMPQCKIESGSFVLFNKKILQLNPRFLRKNKTAIIPFDRNFRASNPKLTILQILSIHYTGKKKDLEQYAMSIIQKAEINIQLNEKASNLSGGMLQRLIAFRELETKPQLLIMCSPTRGMDTKSAYDFVQLIQEVTQKGTAVLILTDNTSLFTQIADKTYTLVSGQIISESIPNTLTKQIGGSIL